MFCCHVMEFAVWAGNKVCRFDLTISHRIEINISTLTNDAINPVDGTIFQR